MKVNHILIGALAASAIMFGSCSKQKTDDARLSKVVVYAYDSFVSEWGAGPEIEARFEAATGYDLELVNCGEGMQVLTRAIFEKDAPQADVIIGVDNNAVQRAIAERICSAYKPKDAERLIPATLWKTLDKEWTFTPYDWSHFAMIYDTQSTVPAPEHLQDLTDSVYTKKIILLDPRTSTPGRGFVAWTVATFGDSYEDFWRALKPNILLMAPGWSSGYGMFTKGEAPLVISYTTSPAYHVEYDNTDRYQVLLFDEGHIMQIEGAGVVRGAPNEKGAKAFMDFLISAEAQATLPLTQWMYPANATVPLPESYQKAAPIATKTVTADEAAVDAAIERAIAILAE